MGVVKITHDVKELGQGESHPRTNEELDGGSEILIDTSRGAQVWKVNFPCVDIGCQCGALVVDKSVTEVSLDYFVEDQCDISPQYE